MHFRQRGRPVQDRGWEEMGGLNRAGGEGAVGSGLGRGEGFGFHSNCKGKQEII